MSDDGILPVPTNPESERAFDEFKKWNDKYLQEKNNKVRLKILVWGPGEHNEEHRRAYKKRKEIRDELAKRNDAFFSEDFQFYDKDSAQDINERAQASWANFVVVVTEGASAWQELIAIIATPEICMKALVHIPERDRQSFGANGPIKDLHAATRGRAVFWYEPSDLDSCRVTTETLRQVEGLRSIHLRKEMNT